MESALRAVKNLHLALQAAAGLGARVGLPREEAFVHPDFALELAALLEDATSDAAALQKLAAGGAGNADLAAAVGEEFREDQAEKVQLVMRDMLDMQRTDTGDSGSRKKLVTMSDLFALQLIQSISTVVDGNTSVLDSDSVDAADRCSLKMFDSQFVRRLVTWLRLTMEAHVNTGKETAPDEMVERLAQAEKDQRGLRDELLSSRATVQKLQKDLQDVRTEEARVAVAAVQALTDDMSTQRAAYEGKVREQYAEILRLKEEKAEAARARDSTDLDIEGERRRLSDQLLDASHTVTALREELQQKEEELSTVKKDLETHLQQKNGPHVILRLLPSNGGSSPTASPTSKRYRDGTATQDKTPTLSSRTSRSVSARLPSARAADIAQIPEVLVDLSCSLDAPASFTRHSLREIIGGNVLNSLHVRIHRISTTLSRKYGIQTYLCASRTQYTWLPPAPGKHGFLQYDLGLKKDQDPAQEPDGLNTANTVATPPIDTEMECHVFVGTGTGSPEVFHYCGFYRIIRADDLTKEEWEGLPSETRKNFVDKAFTHETYGGGKNVRKRHSTTTRDDIRQRYFSGERRMPCMRLECIGFDAAFYEEIVHANVAFFEDEVESGSSPEPSQPEATPSSKRRKVSASKDASSRLSSPHNIDDMYA